MYTLMSMAIQYTIRNIPPEVDNALKRKARLTKKSFNQVVVDELQSSVLKSGYTTDFEWFFGSMQADEAFDAAIAELSKPDTDFGNDPNHTRY